MRLKLRPAPALLEKSNLNLHRRMPLGRAAIIAILSLAPGTVFTQDGFDRSRADTAQEVPAFVRRGLPGRGHAVVRDFEGDWQVEKALYIAVGTRERPAVSNDLIARRRWIAGGRYLHDVTEGVIADGPYYRMGLLGYSNVDARYEWVTVDGLNANMMVYRSDPLTDQHLPNSGRPFELSLSGAFTDQGLISEATAGRTIGQRTVIRFQNRNRHEIDLYFTPPGGSEMLIDHSVYTRVEK